MTTHFAGKFKGNGCTVSYCKQWALRPICGMTTTDKSLVTCKACAKKLGVTPAATVETSKNLTQTCACCFRAQKVKPNGKMFVHGYTRPGYGYIEGGCPGNQFAPYEVSVEGTVYMLGLIKNALTAREAAAEALKTATTLTVTVSVYVRDLKGPWNGGYVREAFTISADDRSAKEFSYKANEYVFGTKVKDSKGVEHFFNFAESAAKQAKEIAQQIESIKSDVAFFETRVTGWVKAA